MIKSAGILLFRLKNFKPEFFLVHPGGPFFKKRDNGAWTIPKGEINDKEDLLEAAKREFFEETGEVPKGSFIELTPIRQKNGKHVFAWAVEGDIDPGSIKSNSFTMEWPPKSGKISSFPEVDRGDWFDYITAKEKIIPEQSSFLDELAEKNAFSL